MRRHLIALLLSSTTVLGACASGPSGDGATVIHGPQEPQIQKVEVPVYVEQPTSKPPFEKPEKKRDPLQVLAEVNRKTIRIPDPNDYIGTVYAIPTVPNIVYQVYMAEGKPTTIDLPPGEFYKKVVLSKPDRWEPMDLGTSESEDGEKVQTISIRPYEGGLKNETLIIKTNRTTHRFNISTYRGNTYHRGVLMKAPAKGLEFTESDALPGVEPLGAEPRIPSDAGDYSYHIGGDRVPWRPSAVFSHAGKTYVELPTGNGPILPPQVVDTSTGGDRVVNWYVSHKRYIVIPDQMLTKAELRRDGKVVQIQKVRE